MDAYSNVLPRRQHNQPAGWIYRRYSGVVYRYARSIVLDEHDADDVTQQVFLKLLTAIDRYQPERGPLEPWILRITRNMALDHLRRRRSRLMADIDPADIPCVGPVHSVELQEALAELTDAQREVVVLMHLGLTPPEIAAVTDRKCGAVHALHHRAQRRLRESLARRGAGPSTLTRRRADVWDGEFRSSESRR